MSVNDGPLAGITVLLLAGIGPSPFAAGLMADLGATVVRVERADGNTRLPQPLTRLGLGDCLILEADLKSEGGFGIVRTMIGHADVLIEGFRPGVAERLGLGPDDVVALNDAIVYARITGWGQEGPYAHMAGHDINYLGLSGVLAAVGTNEPSPPLNLVGDYAGGALYAVVGILSALVERTRTGTGAVVDAAMVDGAASLLGPIRELLNAGLWTERRGSNLLDGGAPFYRTYQTADGGAMAVGALEPAFYDEMVAGLGLGAADLPDRDDPANWHVLAEIFSSAFSTRTREEWQRVFDGTDACVTPVLWMSEVGSHVHNADRGALVSGKAGERPAPAPRMGVSAGRTRAHPAVSDTLVSLGLAEEVALQLEESAASYWV